MWSLLLVPVRTLAAAFWTNWRLLIVLLGQAASRELQEIQSDPFRLAWNEADSCTSNMLEMTESKYKKLTVNHTRALCAYSKKTPSLYKPLNVALRQSSALYSTPAFPFHTIYFWLTSAIQILKTSCETTYRRTDLTFNGKLHQVIRFGQFASSSRNPNLDFGRQTCFQIRTCLGAFISEYSNFKHEQEVLIPPYEKFKIIKILLEMKNCFRIFVLESVGSHTKLNCKVANRNQQIRASIPLIIGFQLIIGFIWKVFSNTAI
uniref:NAD(P)(+)--arginine ADP-ribosyltransferase n=1 Tax=Periophthalmus magnuspinnatus TaxID=409849 RepID=A0A3B4BE64_9GOBI